MKYELMRSKDKSGLQIPQANLISDLKVWYSSIKDWNQLADFNNLVSLEIAGYGGDSFEPISKLVSLKRLRLINFPKLRDISKISHNINIESLALESPPSYDASNKYHEIDSLDPISSLAKMTEFRMQGIKSKDLTLEFITKCPKLVYIEIGRGYSATEYDRIRSAFPESKLILPEKLTSK